MNSIINGIRAGIAKAGGSELKALATDDGLKELWNDKQTLIAEMNKAKKEAAEKAAEPFIELIKEIDQQYAMLLALKETGGFS
jgi:hypothetical protein